MQRFRKAFGDANYLVPIGSYDLVVLDSVGLVSPGTDAEAQAKDFLKFIERFVYRVLVCFFA